MSNDTPDYKKLFELEKQRREEAEDQQRRAEDQQRRAEDQQRRAEDQQRRAEDQQRRAEDQQRRMQEQATRDRDQLQATTFVELQLQCHRLFLLPLRAANPAYSTTGSIPLPKKKYCPTRIEPWLDCSALHQQIYDSVRRYLQPKNGNAPRLFSSQNELEGLSRRITRHPISSEQGLEMYERFAVDHHAGDIIAELCNIPAARQELGLRGGVRFDNHENSLETSQPAESASATTSQPSCIQRPRPDSFCINVIDDATDILLTSGEYKPPHKLPTTMIRLGLRPMDLWDEMVACKKIPKDETEKLRYRAEQSVSSALVQQYHVMIQEGLEVSFVTNGFCDIHLRIPHNDPSTLFYRLYDPTREVDPKDDMLPEPRTAVARRLCLYLLSHGCPIRSQEWRAAAREQLSTWLTSFDHMPPQIPKAEPAKTEPVETEPAKAVPHSDSPEPKLDSPDRHSEYQPSSPPECASPTAKGRRVSTRSQTCRASQEARQERAGSSDSSASDPGPAAARRKRGISQVSPPTSPASQPGNFQDHQGNSAGQHDAEFCTLRCLLGLQHGGVIDDGCPNARLHRQDGKQQTHPITAEQLLSLLEEQLDRDLDRNCTPFGRCGLSGAPFKLTCSTYGYTVVGKGTTTDWWPLVSREADAYRVLQKAQASAVPVFLGTIAVSRGYFLHGAGEIRHMLVMGWGGESPKDIEDSEIGTELERSEREIRRLGVIHEDVRRENVLWNSELRRVLIIDFHESRIVPHRMVRSKHRAKRRSADAEGGVDMREPKRMRVL